MELLQNYSNTNESLKFTQLSEKLLTLTQTRICDRKLLNGYFKNINELDYRQFIIRDKNVIMLLVNQLCSIVHPNELALVTGCSQFFVNLIKGGVILEGITFSNCIQWVLQNLEFSDAVVASDALAALHSLLTTDSFNNSIQDFRKLAGKNSILLKYIYPQNQNWNEEQFLALSCLKVILINKERNGSSIDTEYTLLTRKIFLQILTKLPNANVDKIFFNKMAALCLRILRNLLSEKPSISGTDIVGEVLGIVQVYLFYGIEGYVSINPQLLRPSTMNLPDTIHPIQKKKYFRNYKSKNKKQTTKKMTSESKNNISETNANIKYSSDSDTSDTENRGMIQTESKVRLEAIHLLNTLVEITPNREFFGFWTQIVASGSRTDARVLTRSILREPLSKVRQIALNTLNDLLIGAKMFLSHAEDVEQMSFVTFFGMLSSVIRELHFTLSLLLSSERNVVVLTQALKCAAALAQGTPYSRLKPGLATKLVRNCRSHLLHKDPTVRVAALSVFETLALSEPVTPEIFNILAKSSNTDVDTEFSSFDFNAINETETEEVVFDDYEETSNDIEYNVSDDTQEMQVSALVRVCLKNISNKLANEPVRLQSLKLLGTLAFNASSLIFSHIELIIGTLIDITKEQEPQVAFHACHVMEIIAGRLAESKSDNVSKFWNIAFNPIISFMQHSQTSLREVACDCLGNIGAEMFAQLSRDKSIMIITVLFGAVKDEETAVRAASLRALGLLVSLPSLEEDGGFLMDLCDITCITSKDCNLGVRVKAVWALASLSDCLVKREDNPEVEPIPLEIILQKLYQTSVKAAQDNEKVKCNAVRAIGNIMYLCPDKCILEDSSSGLNALINCATTGNDMKVRWNACRAIGTILSRNPNAILPLSWKDKVFPVLCDLVCNSPNFKVRTNAAWALSVCESYDKYIITLWKSIMMGLENSQHVPSYVEYPHRDALVQQLCLTLCHLAIHTQISELESLWVEIKDHFEDISHHIKHFQEHVLPEKAGDLMKAKLQFTLLSQQATKSSEKQFTTKLLKLFQKEETYEDIDILSVT